MSEDTRASTFWVDHHTGDPPPRYDDIREAFDHDPEGLPAGAEFGQAGMARSPASPGDARERTSVLPYSRTLTAAEAAQVGTWVQRHFPGAVVRDSEASGGEVAKG